MVVVVDDWMVGLLQWRSAAIMQQYDWMYLFVFCVFRVCKQQWRFQTQSNSTHWFAVLKYGGSQSEGQCMYSVSLCFILWESLEESVVLLGWMLCCKWEGNGKHKPARSKFGCDFGKKKESAKAEGRSEFSEVLGVSVECYWSLRRVSRKPSQIFGQLMFLVGSQRGRPSSCLQSWIGRYCKPLFSILLLIRRSCQTRSRKPRLVGLTYSIFDSDSIHSFRVE